jgi:hypothetical protein
LEETSDAVFVVDADALVGLVGAGTVGEAVALDLDALVAKVRSENRSFPSEMGVGMAVAAAIEEEEEGGGIEGAVAGAHPSADRGSKSTLVRLTDAMNDAQRRRNKSIKE